MAIINRDLDVSEQLRVLENSYQGVATGATLLVACAPYPAELRAVRLAAIGLSGSPTYAFGIARFIVGSGYTFITGGMTTLTATAYGTSGIQSGVLASQGSSLLQLLANDQLVLVSGASNAAAAQLQVSFVLQALQDIRSSFGVSS